MLPPTLLACAAGHIHWLSLVIFFLGIISLHGLPTDPPLIFSYDDTTPFPDAIKCFTCDSRKTNQECNDKAYDGFCPQGTKYCYTEHHLNSLSGDSVLVHKLCATNGECTPNSVGCSDFTPQQFDTKKCISCCEGSKCNEAVPTNSSTAIFTTITPYSHGTLLQSSRLFTSLCLVLSTMLVRGWLWCM
ncbi:ly6/PLAUR domain-containing protein 6-like [Strongylocentrotus purpuratus]|uniref:Ly6/PLAUR domain-containing protein 6 n=1 Tax=Strongylocentrotus purpuratus TaxID=7668 RepID=A0A7M7T1C7_STRPU|nr:ly6/PLAUR domain-containing protein 6-like [Strongylocentrotus purpuratus]XP_030846703.1 ly6/PLAUR domain-containing protein 6-like [Strongylocentrotus purpuratus]